MVQGFGLTTLSLAAVSLTVSAIGVWASIRFASRMGLLDVPNERSSHSTPTPRMGGVPMVLAVVLTFVCWILFALEKPFSIEGLSQALLFAVAMAILGFWDDLSGLSPLFRFLVQLTTAVFFLGNATMRIPEVYGIGVVVPIGVCIFVGAVWAVWMLNLYNFMDGIDGLAGGEAVVASSFFCLAFSYYGEDGWAIVNLFIASGVMGFLIFNWPPARVFMGDGGSAFLGAFFGMQSVIASLTTLVPFSVLILPFANFILDTTITLLCRIFRGDKWYQAHRTHYYQRMTMLRMSHRKVTTIEMIASMGSCLAAVIYPILGPWGRVFLIVVVLSVFISTGVWIMRQEKTMEVASPP